MKFLLRRSPGLGRLKMGLTFGILLMLLSCLGPMVAQAHHPMGGETPKNWLTGFLSGLGHPVIGIDHLAFIVASSLMAINLPRPWIVLSTFILASCMGIFLPLHAVMVPGTELAIAFSVILFGLLLAFRSQVVGLTSVSTKLIGLICLVAMAGVVHGYAYGEAILGAETTPIAAYLVGLAAIQGAIAGGSYYFGRLLHQQIATAKTWKYMGLFISGVGVLSLLSQFPTS